MVDLEWTAMQEALGSDVDGNVDPDDGALVACLRRVRQTLIQNQQGIENRSKNLLLNTIENAKDLQSRYIIALTKSPKPCI